MNESRENKMKRWAELADAEEAKQQARRSVADEVLVFLEPESCRRMALGVADVLQNADMDGWTTDAVNRTGEAIATLLRVADIQEDAEVRAQLKARRKERDAEDAGKPSGRIKSEQMLTTIQLEQQEIKANAEAILFSLSQIESFIERDGAVID